MLVLDRKLLTFKVKFVYFCDFPVDIPNCDAICINYCKNKADVDGFKCIEQPTTIIDLTQSLETIWKNMNQLSRRKIRKAEEESFQITLSRQYDEFYKINKYFQKYKGFASLLDPQHPDLQTMEKYGTLFLVFHNDELLAGNLYLEDEERICLWLSASKRMEVDKEKANFIGRANALLHWKVIHYAREKGFKEYDLGGIWPVEAAARDIEKKNMNFFKLSFGGNIVNSYMYIKAYSIPYRFARRVNNTFHLVK